MNEKFNKNAKVEKFTNMLGIVLRLIIIDPYCALPHKLMGGGGVCNSFLKWDWEVYWYATS